MSAQPPLDRDRFAKCRALMERGATPGERAAGLAAATRVAAAAGLSLTEALSRLHGRPEPSRPAPQARPSPRPPSTAPKPAPHPVTLEELRAQKHAAEAHRRRMAAREERRLRAVYAEQARYRAAERDAQAARDRDWAEARAGGLSDPTGGPA